MDIAEQQGVKEKTVHNDAKFSGAVDKVEELLDEDTIGAILCRESKVVKRILKISLRMHKTNQRIL